MMWLWILGYVVSVVLSYLALKWSCCISTGRDSYTTDDRAHVLLFSVLLGPIGIILGLITVLVYPSYKSERKRAKW